MIHEPIKIAVMVSGAGRGSNMQTLIEGCANGHINGSVVVVIGTKADAPAMLRAQAAGVETVAISPADYSGPDHYDEALLSTLQEHSVDLVCLAGFMRLLGSKCVSTYRNRIMNVHPALLPSFCGEGMFGHHVHQSVIDRGAKLSGATVHFVDEHYDNGPIIAQAAVAVLDDDTADTLAARVLEVEHKIYPDAVALFAERRLEIEGRRVRVLEVIETPDFD